MQCSSLKIHKVQHDSYLFFWSWGPFFRIISRKVGIRFGLEQNSFSLESDFLSQLSWWSVATTVAIILVIKDIIPTLDKALCQRGRQNEWRQFVVLRSWWWWWWIMSCATFLTVDDWKSSSYWWKWRPGHINGVVKLVSLSVALTWFRNAWNCQNKTWWQIA